MTDYQGVDMGNDTEAAASMLGAAGLAAYWNTVVGHAAPVVTAYFNRVTNPQPGDLVVETTTFASRERKGKGHEAVGYLVSRGVDTLYDDADGPWTADERRYAEEFWMVRPYLGGEPVRWTNAEFISIPRTSDEMRAWRRVDAEVAR